MGRTDGSVVGSTRIHNNGSHGARFNVVLVAEGYTAAEQTKFNNACDLFVQAMRDDTWFGALVRAINVHRINVESTESGADDPDACDGGADTEADTFFDSSHCTSDIRRLMHADLGLVREICDDEVPECVSGSARAPPRSRQRPSTLCPT